jgi:hypothetical protein
MRLCRLVAAGMALGAALGFLGALLRPRTIHPYHPWTELDSPQTLDPRAGSVDVSGAGHRGENG